MIYGLFLFLLAFVSIAILFVFIVTLPSLVSIVIHCSHLFLVSPLFVFIHHVFVWCFLKKVAGIGSSPLLFFAFPSQQMLCLTGDIIGQNCYPAHVVSFNKTRLLYSGIITIWVIAQYDSISELYFIHITLF